MSRARCAHCDAPKPAERFEAKMCALGLRSRVVHLCAACDVELNRMVLDFIRAPERDEAMAKYEARA